MAHESPARTTDLDTGRDRALPGPSPLQQPWERWKTDWQHAFFAVALGLATLGAATSTGDGLPVPVRLVPAAALGVWYAYWFVLRRDANPPHLPYLLGAAVLWAVMAALDSAMLWVGAAALVPYCMRHARWAVAGIVVTGTGWLWQRFATAGSLDWTAVLGCALGILAVVAVAGYIAMLDREGRKRQQLLDELAAAQAELAAAERQAGILAERHRLARDIHDTLTQGFASISMLLDAALADLPSQGPAHRCVSQAMRTARENLAESRRLVDALRPLHLDGTRLPDAIQQLTSRLADETGIAADTVVTGEPITLDPATETELLRVAQEALTNVRRHAAAQQVTVTVSYLDDLVVIDIQDDGTGFTPSDLGSPPPGVGLTAMRERIGGLGGTLTIESTPGEGTTIAVTAPAVTPPRTSRTAPGESTTQNPTPASR